MRKEHDQVGEIKRITCKSCGAGWECRTGCGIMHGKLDRVAALFPEDIEIEIAGIAKKTALVPFDFSYQLSYCKECQSIESVPVLWLLEEDREYIGRCGQCGQKIELIKAEDKMSCPVCHGGDLETEDIGGWD